MGSRGKKTKPQKEKSPAKPGGQPHDLGRRLGPEAGRVVMTLAEQLEQKGFKRGEETGLQRGREQGVKEGEERGKKEVALRMLARGTPIPEVAELTGLLEDEIRKLAG